MWGRRFRLPLIFLTPDSGRFPKLAVRPCEERG
jgi:hypothetical protein